MCHDEWSGPGAPASLLRRILSSHRLDNASCDNAGETVPSISNIPSYMYIRGIRYRIFFSYPAEVSYYIFPFSVPYVRSTITRDFFWTPEAR